MFRNDRTNPSGSVGGWKGGRDLLRGNPSTNVSDWLNGVGGGIPPSAPQHAKASPIGEMSTKFALEGQVPASPGDSPIVGYCFYKNGVKVATQQTGAWTDRYYTFTGCTTGTTSNYHMTAFNSTGGEGPPSAVITGSNPAAPTYVTTGSYTTFGAGSRTFGANTVDGAGFIVVQFNGSGTWAISANPDNSPVSAHLVGGGGAAYSGWNAGGGGGAGAMYMTVERDNWAIGTTGDALHTVTLGAGGQFNSSSRGGTSSCTNLHWNGSGWDDIDCDGGGQATDYASGATMAGQDGSGGGGGNGWAGANATWASQLNGKSGSSLTLTQTTGAPNINALNGGAGGASGSIGSSGWPSWYGYGGGGGGGAGVSSTSGAISTPHPYHPVGYAGGDATNHGTNNGYGGSGGTGYGFSNNEGYGGIHANWTQYRWIHGVGYGGPGCGIGAGFYTPGYGYGKAASGGSGGSGGTRYTMAYGSVTYTYPYGFDYNNGFTYSSIYHHGMAYSGSGAGTTMTGTVDGGHGGSGAMYVRLHT